MACSYRLVYEVTTIRVPRYTVVSETCDPPSSCCVLDVPTYLCTDEELEAVNSLDICDMRWYTVDSTGFDSFAELDMTSYVVTLPPGSSIVSQECFTHECGDTLSLDCECD